MRKILLLLLLGGVVKADAQLPAIGINVFNFSACTNSRGGELFCTASNVTGYTWQESVDGGTTWSTLSNNSYYTMSVSSTYYLLNIKPPDMTWDQRKYRV